MSDKSKIVLIDDEADLCLLVKGNLEGTGEFEVVATSDPLQAENLCRSEQPDLILLDNVMPGRKGSDIVKTLKKDDTTKNIPIIMISGKGEMIFSRKKGQFQWQPNNPVAQARGEVVEGKNPEALAQAYGVDDYVSKPFTTEVLAQVIKDVLEKAKKRREAAEE